MKRKLKKKNNIFVDTKKKPVMRIKYCLFFLLLFSFSKLSAQEDPLFTFFPWMHSFFNPGAMGEKEHHLNFTGILRQQSMLNHEKENPNSLDGGNDNNSTGNPDKPVKYMQDVQEVLLNIDSYIKQIRGTVGVTFLKDRIGYFDNIGFKIGYATKFRVRGGKLGVGLQLGFLNITPATDKFNPTQTDDPTIANVKQSESTMDFDMGFGLHYRTPKWYVGLSGTQLLGGIRISGESNSFSPPTQLYFTGGYIWDLKTPIPWSIEPHILIQTNLANWRFGVMALARYNGILWFGASVQNMGVAVLFGAVPFYNYGNEYLKGLEIGVGYTFATTKFSYVREGGFGDFELVVRYGFNLYKEKALSGYGSSRHLYKNQY